MNKSVIGAVIIVTAILGYLVLVNQSEDEAVVEEPIPVAEPEVTTEQTEVEADQEAEAARVAAETAAARLQAEAAAAAEAARAESSAAADRLEQEAAAAADVARDLAGRAAVAADGLFSSTLEAASDAANTAADRLETLTEEMNADGDAAQPDQDPTTTETAAVSTDLAAQTDLSARQVQEALTLDGFDYDRAVEVLDASNINEGSKVLLRTVLDQARNSPALLEPALEQVRNALGL